MLECNAAVYLPVFGNETVDVVIFRVTHYRTCYRMLSWSCAVTSLMSLGKEHKEHLGDRAGIVSSAFPSGNIMTLLFFCRLLSPRVLQVNV